MFPVEVIESLKTWLIENYGNNTEIKNITSSPGGSINHAFRITTSKGDYFFKYNNLNLYPGMFEVEMRGLKLLASTNTVYTPEVFTTGNSSKYSFIILKFEERVIPRKDFWQVFANQLAELHKHTMNYYGLDHDNYIGSLKQSNSITADYISFFINERILPLLRSASDAKLLSHLDQEKFQRLFLRLNDLLVIEKPALLHGDLWSGNLIVNHNGLPCLIDPAVYYGHREADLAMTRLFGGFPALFYNAYNERYPLVKGWEERIEIQQLYPLLVHVNLFGSAYVSQVREIIKKF